METLNGCIPVSTSCDTCANFMVIELPVKFQVLRSLGKIWSVLFVKNQKAA